MAEQCCCQCGGDWLLSDAGREGAVVCKRANRWPRRVCVRGPEVVGRMEGYDWLADDEVFPFYELRAAARDYRNGDAFDPEDARRRICAQLDTLAEAKQRYAVLGASGCGAFCNPGQSIAQIYKEELTARRGAFDCVAFAIFSAGYGPGNYPIFRRVFD